MFLIFDTSRRICAFTFPILEYLYHKLNHDENFFTTEIEIPNEGTLSSGNFRLYLKQWKFKMRSQNLLLKMDMINISNL